MSGKLKQKGGLHFVLGSQRLGCQRQAKGKPKASQRLGCQRQAKGKPKASQRLGGQAKAEEGCQRLGPGMFPSPHSALTPPSTHTYTCMCVGGGGCRGACVHAHTIYER